MKVYIVTEIFDDWRNEVSFEYSLFFSLDKEKAVAKKEEFEKLNSSKQSSFWVEERDLE